MSLLFNPRQVLDNCVDAVAQPLLHRELTWQMTKREFSDKYAGQIIGGLWVFMHPLLLMGVYVFVFAFVFRLKFGGTIALPLDYTAYLLSGLIPWLAFQDSMMKSTSVIVANASLVKQIQFPFAVLPVKGVIASFITQLLTGTVLIVYVLVSHGSLHLSYLLIPMLFALQLMFMIGVAYLFSAVGAYFRDLKEVVQIYGAVGLFISPVFFQPDQVPAALRWLVYLNPFSYVAWSFQDIFYFGRFEHPWAWAVLLLLGIGSMTVGYGVFKMLRTTFGNIL